MSSFWKLHLLCKEGEKGFTDTEDRSSRKSCPKLGSWLKAQFLALRRLRQDDSQSETR